MVKAGPSDDRGSAVMRHFCAGWIVRIRGIVSPHRVLQRSALLLCAALCLAFIAPRAMGAAAPMHTAPLATAPLKADKVLVLKSKRRLVLLRNGVVLKSYRIALGPQPRGPKRQSGDGKTPEGLYTIDGRNEHSAYHLSLHISYPNPDQQVSAIAAHLDPGGDIFIHGLPTGFVDADRVRFRKDWTEGCIAVENVAIEEIWNAVDDGTPIEIRP
jgi:murein L,D-transpeptidase YafK